MVGVNFKTANNNTYNFFGERTEGKRILLLKHTNRITYSVLVYNKLIINLLKISDSSFLEKSHAKI